MRFSKLAVAACMVAMVACGKKDEASTTTTTTPATPPAAPPTTGAPITGETKVVQMVGDANGGARFEPATITIKAGDGIRFEVISLPPHNVAFDPAVVPEPAKAVLKVNMPSQDMGELQGKLLNNIGETYTLSFANVPPGTYEITCTPHVAMNMKMKVIVQ